MKKVLLGTVASLCLMGGAFAADMNTKAPTVSVAATSASPWNGFYIGGNVGFGNNDVGASAQVGNLNGGQPVSQSNSNLLGGFQLGYNRQFGHFLWGIESDFNLTGFKQTNVFGAQGIDTSLPMFGTTRLRGGIIAGEVLFYGTGGVAYGQEDISGGGTTAHMPTLGWAGGAGLEWMFAPQWTVGAEYLHVNMKGITADGPITADTHTNSDIGRFKLNYLF